MTQLHTTSLHRQAETLLDEYGGSPKRLMLLHTAVSLGATLAMTAIGFLLSLKIADTSGLGGIAARSILTTAQSLLEFAVMILLPFWEIGILRVALDWRNGENAPTSRLMAGFHKFGNVFGVRFWSGALYIAVGFSLCYFSTSLFLMTPWGASLFDRLSPLAQAATTEQLQEMLTPELTQQLTRQMLPLLIIYGLLFGAVSIILFYRMRFADFFVMEGSGGVKAIANSFRLTRGNCLQILKLDLHFWWFYVLQGLSLVICYGDWVLSALGITLPFGPDGNFFLFYVIGILLQGILFWQYNAERLTTYCLAFDAFRSPEPVEIPSEM